MSNSRESRRHEKSSRRAAPAAGGGLTRMISDLLSSPCCGLGALVIAGVIVYNSVVERAARATRAEKADRHRSTPTCSSRSRRCSGSSRRWAACRERGRAPSRRWAASQDVPRAAERAMTMQPVAEAPGAADSAVSNRIDTVAGDPRRRPGHAREPGAAASIPCRSTPRRSERRGHREHRDLPVGSRLESSSREELARAAAPGLQLASRSGPLNGGSSTRHLQRRPGASLRGHALGAVSQRDFPVMLAAQRARQRPRCACRCARRRHLARSRCKPMVAAVERAPPSPMRRACATSRSSTMPLGDAWRWATSSTTVPRPHARRTPCAASDRVGRAHPTRLPPCAASRCRPRPAARGRSRAPPSTPWSRSPASLRVRAWAAELVDDNRKPLTPPGLVRHHAAALRRRSSVESGRRTACRRSRSATSRAGCSASTPRLFERPAAGRARGAAPASRSSAQLNRHAYRYNEARCAGQISDAEYDALFQRAAAAIEAAHPALAHARFAHAAGDRLHAQTSLVRRGHAPSRRCSRSAPRPTL